MEQEEVDDLIATLEAAEDLLDCINHTFPDGSRLDSSRVINQDSVRQFLKSDSIALVQHKEVWGQERILTNPLRYNPNNFRLVARKAISGQENLHPSIFLVCRAEYHIVCGPVCITKEETVTEVLKFVDCLAQDGAWCKQWDIVNKLNPPAPRSSYYWSWWSPSVGTLQQQQAEEEIQRREQLTGSPHEV